MAQLSPDRLRSLLQADSDAEATPSGAATPPDAPAGPTPSPMSTPEPKMGNKEGALVQLSMAADLIELAVPSLGSDSEQGKAAMVALKQLNGILGSNKPRTEELQPAEIMQLLGSLPQAGNVTPEVAAVLGPNKSQQSKPAIPAPATGAPPPQAQAA